MRSFKIEVRQAVKPLASTLARWRIQANWLSYAGVALNVMVAVMVWQGWFVVGGALFLVVNALDLLDGAVARAAGTAGGYGAFLDSVLDRYSEAVVFVGLMLWYASINDVFGLGATGLALTGSFMVSYCRARAEGLGLDCEVGLLQRPERIVTLGVGIMAGAIISEYVLLAVVTVLAVLTNFTAAQRMRHVARLFGERRRVG